MFTILGLRLIPNIDGAEVDPAPAAAPVERIIGALGAKYLKPINIIILIQPMLDEKQMYRLRNKQNLLNY